VPQKRQKRPIAEHQLRRWQLFPEFAEHLERAFKDTPLHPTWVDPQRLMQISDYLSLFLLGLFNPVITSMRGLCSVSRLARVQAKICSRPISKSTFSEAQSVIDPALLKRVFESLAQEVARLRPGKTKTENRYAAMMQAVDSSLWYALPRMHWALWREQHGIQRAFRLHVAFQVIDELPSQISVRPARRCERLEWQTLFKPGEFHVGDRNYGEDYGLLGRLDRQKCFYAVRLRSDAQWVVQEELPLTPEDRAADVVWQGWVRLGKEGLGPRVRIVQILGPEEPLFIVTNLSPEQLSAELVSLCYRQRWAIELFFRWLKHLMRAKHLLAESENGVSIQIYLTLIAAQLLLLFSGERPNRRELELLEMMVLGWASPKEVIQLIKQDRARRKKKS
jgi:hypothetical protein